MASTKELAQKIRGKQTSPAVRNAAPAAGPAHGNGKDQPQAGCRLSADERKVLVEQIAHDRAEKRGFAPGGDVQDWFEAKAEVKRLLRRVHHNVGG